MENRIGSLLYLFLGIYVVMISWFYYHNVFYAIINYLFWPLSLIYFLLTGKLADGMWRTILESYF